MGQADGGFVHDPSQQEVCLLFVTASLYHGLGGASLF